jgi:hypothetical protein
MEMKTNMNIPEKFYKATKRHPRAKTVGALKKILAELPDNLRIESDWGKAVEAVVYNHGTKDMHLEFKEADR